MGLYKSFTNVNSFLLGDVCCNPLSIGGLQKFIQQEVPEIYIISLKIGKTVREVNLRWQLFFHKC